MGLRHLPVFGAAFMRLLLVGNTIVGNAIWLKMNAMHVMNLPFNCPFFLHALHDFFGLAL